MIPVKKVVTGVAYYESWRLPAVMISYSSLSKISIISAAVITCGSFGKCLRLPVTKKESSLLRQIYKYVCINDCIYHCVLFLIV